MRENESLWRLARKCFESLLALEAGLAEIAGTEADGPAVRLARRMDELKPFDSIFKDFSDDQPDVRPLIDVLRRALDDLPGWREPSDLPGTGEWHTAVSYLKELHAGISAVCENFHYDPAAEPSELVEAATPAEAAADGVPELVAPESFSKLEDTGQAAASAERSSPSIDEEWKTVDDQEASSEPAAEMPEPADAESFPESEVTAQVAASAESHPPSIDETRESVDSQVPAEAAADISPGLSGKNLADLLPGAEGPVVYFLIKISAESENAQKAFNLIKMLMDKALPIMGETGKHFYYPLDLNLDKSFSVVAAEGGRELVETFGLAVTLEEGQIVLRGRPPVGFDGPLYFSFARFDHLEEAQTHKKPMYIAADPRTLWQDLPVEDFEGYPVESEAREARRLADTGKIVVAASCRGRSHAHAAKPRDDSFLIGVDEGSGWNFVAVADGAGSSRFSRKGSALACEIFSGTLKQILASSKVTDFFQANRDCLTEWKRELEAADGRLEPASSEIFLRRMAENGGLSLDAVVYSAVYAGYKAIEDEARARESQVRDYHTTLICAAFRKFDFGWFIISYWVGDGAIAVCDWNRRGRVLVPGVPDGGEFAGQTRFLTMGREEINPEAVARRTRYIFADDFETLILATDGITDAFFPSEKSVLDEAEWRNFWSRTLPTGDADAPPCPELFDGRSSLEDQAQALRRWLDFWSKGNHDDRTILIVK